MNEHLLKAMIELMALLSNLENLSAKKKVIPFSDLQNSLEVKLKNLMARKSHVQWYLDQELNKDGMTEYIKMYDQLMESGYQISVDNNQIEIAPFDKLRANQLAKTLNQGLSYRQKVIVFIRMLEYALLEKESAGNLTQVFKDIAKAFNFEESFLDSVRDFLTASVSDIPDNPNILLVDGNCATNIHPERETYKTYHIHGLNEQLLLLHFPNLSFLVLRYFGSGMNLNGHLISSQRAYAFTPGSKLSASDTTSIYYSILQSCFFEGNEDDEVVFNAKDVYYTFKNGNVGLKDINISEATGSLVGIMGGSGTGKSTLLNVLNGNLHPSKGEITINGVNLHDEKDQLEGVIGYVSQDDLLIEELTVFQNLFYNSKLCFDNLSDNQIKERVTEMLTTLGLAEAANLKVGSPLDKMISGGQRKRLNIALELIREPKVLFLDEPTSGLSSQDSENIMDFVKELTLKGELIFVVIHQPSSDIFKMFDKMFILDVGGVPIYYGNPLDSVNYFKRRIDHVKSEESECPHCGNVNPEIIFEIIESKVLDSYGNVTRNRSIKPEKWYAYYKADVEPNLIRLPDRNEIPDSDFAKPGWFTQFFVFFKRDVLAKLKNTQYVLINFLEAPALALILSYFLRYFPTDETAEGVYSYFENSNIPVYIFISVVVALFLGLSVSAEEIIKDRKIRKRESFLNLSKSSYLASKVSFLFALSAIQMLSFLLIGNTLLGIQGMTFSYWVVLFSAACFSNILGLNISSSFTSVVTVYILIPFLIIPQIIFSGVLVPFQELNPSTTSQKKVPIIGELMVSRWAFEAIAVHQFKTNAYEELFYPLNKKITNAHFMKNYWIPELENANRALNTYWNDPTKEEHNLIDVNLLKKQIQNHSQETGYPLLEELNRITLEKYASQFYPKMKSYLKSMKSFYNKKYNDYVYQKDDKIRDLLRNREGGNTFFNALLKDHSNQSLNDILTNRNEAKKIVRIGDELIQRENIVYTDSDSFRSPYFVATKQVGNYRIDTYWANIAVIWLLSAFLAFTLYFDSFKSLGKLYTLWRKRLLKK